MENLIKSKILANAETLFGTTVDESLIQFQKTRKDVKGDLTLVIFPFVKLLRCNPIEAGTKIGDFLVREIDSIGEYEVVNGFLNLVISTDFWLNELKNIHTNPDFGLSTPDSKPTIMVEYSSPNTEILKANGHKVVKTQIINDRGIHICKSMLAWDKFSPVNAQGERETPHNTGLKGDKLVGKYYVEFDKRFNAEAKEIIAEWENGIFENYSSEIKAEFIRLTKAKEGKDEKAAKGTGRKRHARKMGSS
jgi:arginyl-tRNA synthetase